jgi:serine/threonine protein kinase
VAGDIASGMHYLHTRPRPVIHRDLKKSDNVLMTAAFPRPILANFGVLEETNMTAGCGAA